MKKLTKGSIAAGAAAVLLLGGLGSVAYWTAEGEVGGDTISSGSLTLTDTTDDTCAAALWTLDADEDVPNVTFDPAEDTIVPGDELTKVCTFELGAVGNHLRATPTVTTAAEVSGSINPAGNVTVGGTFTNDGIEVTEVTEADNQDILTATITMTFPYGEEVDNTTQEKEAILTDYAVTLTQVHN